MVRVTKPMPDLTPPIEAEIDAIWRMEQSRLGNVLFNGRVFSGDVITPELVTGHWTEYRRIVAQLRRPELYEHIRIRPLAVGGVIQSPDGFIFGRRQPKAVYQAGEWQLPPAGNVDPTCEGPNGEVNVTAMLLTELGEELGLTPDLARVWWECRNGHGEYLRKKAFVPSKDGFCSVDHEVLPITDAATRRRFGANLIAGAMKKLAQGEQKPSDGQKLLPSIARILVNTWIKEEGKRTRVVVNGKPEVIDIWERVLWLASRGVPAAVRLKVSLEEIQPLVLGVKTPASEE
jgi:hypothetical protein